MSEEKPKFESVIIGDYCESIDEETGKSKKYFRPRLGKDADGNYTVAPEVVLTGSDWRLYVNLYDDAFRQKHDIPKWKRGTLSVSKKFVQGAAPSAGKAKPAAKKVDEDEIQY